VILENLRIAFAGLAANKLRSALTMLGILIGVAAVVLLLAVGAGAQAFVQGQFEALGTNTLTVFPAFEGDGAAPAALTDADVEALRQQAPAVGEVAPTLSAQVTATVGENTHDVGVFDAVTAPYATITNLETASGTLFTDEDVAARRRVAVIGQTVAEQLFPGEQAVGREVRIERATFEVIGLLTPGGAGGFGGDPDDRVLVPITAAEDTITGPQDSYGTIVVAARSQEETAAAAEQVRAVLTLTHGLAEGEEPDFNVFEPAALLEQVSATNTIFTVVLGAIGAISLLVGGIGVMNIMLVTVTERTREIGIRKAIGARRSDLLVQFLFESVTVSAVGGVLGIALGVLGAQVSVGDFSPVILPWSIALAFGVSVAVGLFFGIYPANRAARLRPIDALRYE
jgi:putative ABC transport system permease protein